jgi:hypothetical protein
VNNAAPIAKRGKHASVFMTFLLESFVVAVSITLNRGCNPRASEEAG